ncbi:hypothetical protein [Photobacterium ganghwense]
MENKDKDLLAWPQAFRDVAFKVIDTLPLILFMVVLIVSAYMR